MEFICQDIDVITYNIDSLVKILYTIDYYDDRCLMSSLSAEEVRYPSLIRDVTVSIIYFYLLFLAAAAARGATASHSVMVISMAIG